MQCIEGQQSGRGRVHSGCVEFFHGAKLMADGDKSLIVTFLCSLVKLCWKANCCTLRSCANCTHFRATPGSKPDAVIAMGGSYIFMANGEILAIVVTIP